MVGIPVSRLSECDDRYDFERIVADINRQYMLLGVNASVESDNLIELEDDTGEYKHINSFRYYKQFLGSTLKVSAFQYEHIEEKEVRMPKVITSVTLQHSFNKIIFDSGVVNIKTTLNSWKYDGVDIKEVYVNSNRVYINGCMDIKRISKIVAMSDGPGVLKINRELSCVDEINVSSLMYMTYDGEVIAKWVMDGDALNYLGISPLTILNVSLFKIENNMVYFNDLIKLNLDIPEELDIWKSICSKSVRCTKKDVLRHTEVTVRQ